MTHNPNIKAVIFDFGGVFTTSPISNFAVYEKENGLPERFLGGVIKANINDGPFAQFERAEITIDEFDTLFAAETKAAGYEVRGRTLVGLLKLEFYPEMIETLSRVKQAGFQTGCITNNMASHDSESMVSDSEGACELAAIFANFDEVIESSKIGMRKPEPRIYELMCKKLNRTPEECVFIDDLGINLKPAKAMGMETIRVPFDGVTPAIKALNALLDL